MSITVVKTSVSREANFEVVGDRVLPTENRHSEGAAGKAACHRQNCSDGMPSHQGVFSVGNSLPPTAINHFRLTQIILFATFLKTQKSPTQK